MQYYRCQCGEVQAWGSMPPDPCRGCEKCGTSLNSHPDLHRPPQPHQWVLRGVETDDGHGTLTVCGWCGIKKKDFEDPWYLVCPRCKHATELHHEDEKKDWSGDFASLCPSCKTSDLPQRMRRSEAIRS